VRGGSHRKSFTRSSALLLLMLWMVLAPAVPTKAQPTATMDITVAVSTDAPIYLPMSFTVPYMLQLVDPSSGTINILYPNRMLNISSQQLVTIGSYTVDSIQNKITFWTGINVTATGNYTYNFRLIYDSTLMTNNTIDTSLRVYSTFPWVYRMPITIGNASSAQTDYQIGLYLNLSAQVSAGKIKIDLGDLRFTDSSGNALSYWIENATASAARIWVKMPSIPASPSTTTIYMYYGNPSATTTSNGTATFVFFDDFESYASGSAIDNQGGWITKRVGGSGEATVRLVNGRNHLHISSTNSFTTVDYPCSVSNAGYALRIYEYGDNVGEAIGMSFTDGQIIYDGDPYNGYKMDWWGWGGGYSKIIKKVSGTRTELASISDSDTANVYHTLEFRWYGSSLQGYRDETLKISATDTYYTSQSHIQFHIWTPASRYIDWVLVRKHVSPEPTYSVGSEQVMINYACSVSYGQLSTETQLTVKIPTFSPVQTFTANVSGSYTAPTPLPDAIKIIYNMEYGRYALALLPILFMLVAGKHYAGIMGILACGISALINVTVGVALFDWTVLGIIAFVCILLIFTEGG
jgi:hypothetical protein